MRWCFCSIIIKQVEFHKAFNLDIIENSAFCSSGLERISIPASVAEICGCAFIGCNDSLKLVEIPKNSKLQIIGKAAFQFDPIESIFIPQTVTFIGGSAFKNTLLQSIQLPFC